MVVKIDNVDITDCIAYNGFKWQRSDIDAPNSGRTLDGVMHRGRVATKIRLDITCRLLTGQELHSVLNAVAPEYVTVEYDDPMLGRVVKQMYSNNNPASFQIKKRDGREFWSGVTFPLVEV